MLRSQRIVLSLASLLFSIVPALASDPEVLAADERMLQTANMPADGPALLEFFRKRTVRADDWDRLKTLVRLLGDKSFQVRERASTELTDLGSIVVPLLRQALKDPDLEVARRAEECLRRIEQQNPGAALAGAAARLIGLHKPPGAAEVLLAYLPFADDELVADEVCNALSAMSGKDATIPVRIGAASMAQVWMGLTIGLATLPPETALLSALADRVPVRRAAAAEAVCRAGLSRHLPGVRKLLEDPDPLVRLRAGLALAYLREKVALPVLIDLLAVLPPGQAQRAELVLYQLAQDQAPPVPVGRDDAARRLCRDAWLAWWRAHGSAAELARLDKAPRVLGYTLLVFLDDKRIVELDAENKVLWQIDGLEKPLDAQGLPGDRVLIAEYDGNRVTERNRKGEILWEKKIDGPLVAQRLANGNTFIVTQAQFMEVDRTGREIYVRPPPAGESIMKATKLPNGDIACVTTPSITPQARYVRIDVTGNNEPATFPAHVKTFGGRIDVLPNGNVLVPENANNRVVEYDPRGRIVWDAQVSQPVAAVRLANGNTLVTSMNENRAVEFDRTGRQQVWEHKADTRVTRAFRR